MLRRRTCRVPSESSTDRRSEPTNAGLRSMSHRPHLPHLPFWPTASLLSAPISRREGAGHGTAIHRRTSIDHGRTRSHRLRSRRPRRQDHRRRRQRRGPTRRRPRRNQRRPPRTRTDPRFLRSAQPLLDDHLRAGVRGLPHPAPRRQAGRPRRHRRGGRGHTRRPVGLGTRIQRPTRQRRLAHARRTRRCRARQSRLRDGLLLPRQLRQLGGDVDCRDQLRNPRSARRPDPARRERRSDRDALRASLGPRPSRLDAIPYRHARTRDRRRPGRAERAAPPLARRHQRRRRGRDARERRDVPATPTSAASCRS